jgi:hypothetical protein
VLIRRAFNISLVLACLKNGRGKDLGAELTKQMVTTRRTIAERNLLSMQVISIIGAVMISSAAVVTMVGTVLIASAAMIAVVGALISSVAMVAMVGTFVIASAVVVALAGAIIMASVCLCCRP